MSSNVLGLLGFQSSLATVQSVVKVYNDKIGVAIVYCPFNILFLWPF